MKRKLKWKWVGLTDVHEMEYVEQTSGTEIKFPHESNDFNLKIITGDHVVLSCYGMSAEFVQII